MTLVAISFGCLSAAAQTEAAAVLYSTTDLGAGYKLQADPGGQVRGVTDASGDVTYAFDKAPVTLINVQTGSPYSGHAYSYELLTMENGAHRVGYVFDYGGDPGNVVHNSPTFEPWSNGWGTPPGVSPVTDINAQGQVVGMSGLSWGPGSYAAFSDVNGGSHGFGATTVDNLNTYILPIPGVTLISGLRIDDRGRILAGGSDGHDYLLTPIALGPPETVPEPTTLMMLGAIGAGLGVRAIRRRMRA